ncbi:hypothetical protein COO60DRAFT_83266 [Scenedesmus sp. NREL 46B-D3]|nr:hypothetical protein COO60DRAFT_83266 [Scenedesmus sp. NREL 46B-D3]
MEATATTAADAAAYAAALAAAANGPGPAEPAAAVPPAAGAAAAAAAATAAAVQPAVGQPAAAACTAAGAVEPAVTHRSPPATSGTWWPGSGQQHTGAPVQVTAFKSTCSSQLSLLRSNFCGHYLVCQRVVCWMDDSSVNGFGDEAACWQKLEGYWRWTESCWHCRAACLLCCSIGSLVHVGLPQQGALKMCHQHVDEMCHQHAAVGAATSCRVPRLLLQLRAPSHLQAAVGLQVWACGCCGVHACSAGWVSNCHQPTPC